MAWTGKPVAIGARAGGDRILPEMVPLAGLEPALLAELDFESSASTNFTTGAQATLARPKARRFP